MPETKHTPGPWKAMSRLGRGAYIEGADGTRVCDKVNIWADAETIVRAVNAHADLLAALEFALHALQADGAEAAASVLILEGRAAIAKARS